MTGLEILASLLAVGTALATAWAASELAIYLIDRRRPGP